MRKINYKSFIEENFQIINKEGKVVPFILNGVQSKYYDQLANEYPTKQGMRELILKARQEGMSSLILAIFATDFLHQDDPIASLCVSHKIDATKKLFQKVKFFIESACVKGGMNIKNLLDSDNVGELRNKFTGAYFWIGTAGAKVGGRGTTVQNIHFSETAHYPNTEILNAREIISATLQMVQIGTGKVFSESTANGFGNYYQVEWERATRGDSNFKPRFFSWRDFYTQEWIDEKRKEFADEALFKQEYPETPEEAFIASGSPFFDMATLAWYKKEKVREPIRSGYLASDGGWI